MASGGGDVCGSEGKIKSNRLMNRGWWGRDGGEWEGGGCLWIRRTIHKWTGKNSRLV